VEIKTQCNQNIKFQKTATQQHNNSNTYLSTSCGLAVTFWCTSIICLKKIPLYTRPSPSLFLSLNLFVSLPSSCCPPSSSPIPFICQSYHHSSPPSFLPLLHVNTVYVVSPSVRHFKLLRPPLIQFMLCRHLSDTSSYHGLR